MRDWILKHKKLYFFIVGVIAFVAFSIITLFGVVRLASAATTDSAWFEVDGNSIPDITTLDFSTYAEHFEEEYGYTGNIGEKILKEHKYCVVVVNGAVWPSQMPYVSYLFTNEPVVYEQNDNRWLLADWNNSVSFELREGTVQYMRGYGMNNWDGTNYGYGPNLIPFVVNSTNGSSQVIASSYDLGDELYCHPSYVRVEYPALAEYIFDLDYTFDSVTYEQSGNLGSEMLWTLYFDRNPDIVYPSLLNYYIDVSYRFVLPDLDLLQDFVELGVSAWSDDAVDLWRFNSKEKRIYDYTASYLAPQGIITLDDLCLNLRNDWESFYGVSFDEDLYELALRYSYPQVTALYYMELGTDGNYHIGQTCVVHSYEYYLKLYNGLISPSVLKNIEVNTHGVPLDYVISVADVSSKNDYDELLNQYQQEVQKNEEFEQALKDAQEEVELAKDALQKAHETMGLSGFLDVFEDIAKSFESAGDAVGSIARGVGSAFAFLPTEITACLSFGFLFLIFVAIYKALRG